MKKYALAASLSFWFLFVSAMVSSPAIAQPGSFKNTWTTPPAHIPDNASIDAPLMGNGRMTMSVGYNDHCLRYYLSRNDFWRLRSQADNLSGPRVAAWLNINIIGSKAEGFSAEQLLQNGITTCRLSTGNNQELVARSWVSATEDMVFIELSSVRKEIKLSIRLTAPENNQAEMKTGTKDKIQWLTRAFTDSVDIVSEVAVGLKILSGTGPEISLRPGKKMVLAICTGSKFNQKDPLAHVLNRLGKTSPESVIKMEQAHNKWWAGYWKKSSMFIDDSVLMKAWYQGLYTMAACSRDPRFPPGLFGWTTTDTPAWNGDYHLNYNFEAPFYALQSSNRLEQALPHDAPLLAFLDRGRWYAEHATKTRGILLPVGIGPLGIEPTRNFAVGGYQKPGDIEEEGLFYGQRSNAAYGLINMAQYWRCTYDPEYGKRIYPYALGVVDFWEDYLKYENGRYVIYGDAIHEGSGMDKNPILSLGLIRNAFELIIDLSNALGKDKDRQEKWKDFLLKLSDLPVQVRNGREVFRYTEEGVDWWDDNGLGIQHIYPANAITPDSKERDLVIARNTIDEMQRWQDNNTSSSFFVAAIRVGYDPVKILDELHRYALHTYSNGFQLDNPHGIENSCTVTNALNEMACMSAGNVIRLFGNFPTGKNAAFKNIRAWGAFLVSARHINGKVSGVSIFSEKGRPCSIVNPWPGRKVQLIRNGVKETVVGGSRISFRTSAGETTALNPIIENQ
ncbi:glycosyl hydrolase family 95 catalytic domain-containing protein [Flavihumibacter profundi]|jgi:alpha-L-fucosidase 2|uniref:glycosyl hydrolase family 95 catalytic domain-containing protein n=1 Tax=Flavihumibacter profundi TaxID=2716883 RepID=UPI001CC47445|nr:hypothetical protein [Flavihumibacter profundi]MBZ5855519.1 hypothetical protein [Flavihumibacter profundi]